MNRRPGVALIDSGYTQTLAKKGWVKPDTHRDIRAYPTGGAYLEVKGKRTLMRMGIVPNLPYDIILG